MFNFSKFFLIATILVLLSKPILLSAQESDANLQVLENKIKLKANKQNTIQQAVLTWCIEDAKLANTYNQIELAKSRADDAALLLEDKSHAYDKLFIRNVNVMNNDLLPLVDTINNPFYDNFKFNIKKLLNENQRFVKGAQGALMSTPSGWSFLKKGNEVLMLVQAFCHPQSSFNNSPALVSPILRRFTAYFEYLKPSSPVFNDFSSNGFFFDAYCILKTTHPEVIPPKCKQLWEAELRANADSIYQKRIAVYSDASQSNGLINEEIGYILDLSVAYRFFKTPEYLAAVNNGLRYIKTNFLPDGGTNYIHHQNEAFSYHAIVVSYLARIGQLTPSTQALNMLKSLRWYYPLSVEPGGVAEWGSAPSWHHYWMAISGANEANIIASLTNCPYNKTISTDVKVNQANLWAASFYNNKILPKPLPDNYMVFDQNIQGPRGRYGKWSFFGNGRNYGDQDNQGKSNYVGCMVLDDPSTFWPLNSALQDAGMEIIREPKKSYTDELRRKFSVISLSAKENISTSVSSQCAALGSNCLLSVYTGKPEPWRQKQLWLFTPTRMVGFVSVIAEENYTSFGVQGDLLLLSRGLNAGIKKMLQKIDTNKYSYGNLNITIHASDFAGIGSEETDVYVPSDKGSCRLMLMDKAALNGGVKTNYPKGSSHFYVVEIAPKWSSPLISVNFRNTKDLLYLQVADNTGKYTAVYNYTDEDLKWDVDEEYRVKKAIIHSADEKYRPLWIGSGISNDKSSRQTLGATKSLNIGKGSLILLEQH